ncbi:TolC family protein [Nitrosomonas sp. JL21]|uniref:TolC family protein n=1 Tax=Nitrosomonas sp. JL21 TaxID=153949 RepID=UPI00136A8C16|nr:TolC family protein [Nitrosomonas sp. JL21]MXS78816.1 TolC family protein [Nitrosomonas sp. JL21]
MRYFISRYFLSIVLLVVLNSISDVIAENKLSNTGHLKQQDLSISFSQESNDITLRDAVRLALKHNPELAAFAKEMEAQEGVTLQAGLIPNPDLSVNVENVGNIGSLRGDINSEKSVAKEIVQQLSTIRISQIIELGGKRADRIYAASLGEQVALQDYEIRKLDLIAQVANAFTEVLATQEQFRLAEETQHLAQTVVNTVAKRVQAGQAPPIEETKVEVVLSATQVAFSQAQRDLSVARSRLGQLWGNSSPQFVKSVGNLESLISVPSLEALTVRALKNPMALRALKNLEQRKSLLEVEKSRRIPNLTVSAGAVHHAAIGGTTAVVSVAVPLPLFNRNQGNIKEAQQRIYKAADEQAVTELRIKTDLAQAYETLTAAQTEVNMLSSKILPGAARAFGVTKKGYEMGKFGFLELLDAQRTLFQNQILYIRALANYQRLVNEIERLIAGSIEATAEHNIIYISD